MVDIPKSPKAPGRHEHFTRQYAAALGNYLLLVDYTARLFREGKAVVARDVAEILDRLGSSPDHW
jgi:hypothetical protein